MNYVIKEKGNKRCIAIIDESLVEFFRTNFSIFEIIKIDNFGTSTFTINEGTIITISFIL